MRSLRILIGRIDIPRSNILTQGIWSRWSLQCSNRMKHLLIRSNQQWVCSVLISIKASFHSRETAAWTCRTSPESETCKVKTKSLWVGHRPAMSMHTQSFCSLNLSAGAVNKQEARSKDWISSKEAPKCSSSNHHSYSHCNRELS